jgi:RNA polymerase sigma factor (sigma-70 family)
VLVLHGPALLRFCAAQVGREQAEDCFQETVLAALRAYTTLRDGAAVRSWLFSIAARKAIDLHRAQARAPEPRGDIASLAGASEFAIGDESLWAEVRALAPKQRQAVTLRYLADLSYREIATAMKTSEAAARRNTHDGLKHLRQTVER